jgi:Plasmid pRiA4b ORF-3-like protein
MGSVADKHFSSERSDRHLRVVPDNAQSALWDNRELDRLARLRQLAIMTDAPAEAMRLIDGAVTADEAIELLTDSGFMPTEAESGEGLLSWFAPLLEPGSDQVQAEICGSEFIAELRRAAPPNLDVADVLGDVVEGFAAHRRPEALAMMRVLSVIGPEPVRTLAANAAGQMVRDGRADPPWAAGLGFPAVGRCFGYTDVYGEQRSMVITFRYGRKAHALIVLIDYLLGGGIKDCYVTDYTESLRSQYQKMGRDPEIVFSDLDVREAHAILIRALAYEPCPVEPEQVEDVEACIELLRARVAVLPPTASAATQADKSKFATGAAAKAVTPQRAAGPKYIHRVKATLRGAKPPIWRRFEVTSDTTLQRLHRVIQIGFEWQDYHLHVFDTAAGRYGIPDPDGELDIRNDANKKLSAVADWPGDRIRYTYDFGDWWELDIVVEAVLPAEAGLRYPRCTGGRRAAPPEDCGGVWGYADLLNILADPRHEEHQARLEWLGIQTAAEFDSGAFDSHVVNLDLTIVSRVLVKP